MTDEQKSLRSSVISGALWQFSSKFGSSLASFVIQMVLARLLVPEQFALIALTTIFLEVAELFIDGGFASALVQKLEVDELDLSSAFYFNLVVGVVAYGVIYLISPFAADYFRAPELEAILKVISIGIIISSFGVVQNAVLQRNMLFKKRFVISFAAVVGAGIAGIIAALNGLGVWALVISQLVNRVIYTSLLIALVRFQPKLMFSFDRIKHMFTFGGNIFINNILNVIYGQIPSLIFGRVFTKELLGFLTQSEKINEQINANVQGTLVQVFFPAFSKLQQDLDALKRAVLRASKMSSYVFIPVMIGLVAAAGPVIFVVFGKQWGGSVIFLRILAVMTIFQASQCVYIQALLAQGKSRPVLYVEILTKILVIGIYFLALPFGPYWLIISVWPTSLMKSIAYYAILKRSIDLSWKEFIKDMGVPILFSTIMGIPVYLIEFISLPAGVLLILQIITGVAIYVALSQITRYEPWLYLKDMVKDKFARKA